MTVRAEVTELDRVTLRTRYLRDGRALTTAEVLEAWRDEEAFRGTFARDLADAPFEAFFWETPAWRAAELDRAYEHVVRDAPPLAGIAAEPGPFRFHLGVGRGVVTFPNLGGDADLVVPAAEAESEAYPHLAAFVRRAPAAQVDALLAATASALEARLERDAAPTWLSTSGLGVAWVHVRLDARPKYYTWAPYRAG